MSNNRNVDTNEIELLVKASQEGSRGAFDALVRFYQQMAMQAAIRILGDANEAADSGQKLHRPSV